MWPEGNEGVILVLISLGLYDKSSGSGLGLPIAYLRGRQMACEMISAEATPSSPSESLSAAYPPSRKGVESERVSMR